MTSLCGIKDSDTNRVEAGSCPLTQEGVLKQNAQRVVYLVFSILALLTALIGGSGLVGKPLLSLVSQEFHLPFSVNLLLAATGSVGAAVIVSIWLDTPSGNDAMHVEIEINVEDLGLSDSED